MKEALLSVGLNYHQAPVALRSLLVFTPEQVLQALPQLVDPDSQAPQPGAVREAVLLSTCNRVELYLVVGGNDESEACHAAEEAARCFLTRHVAQAVHPMAPELHQEAEQIGRLCFVIQGDEVGLHLLRVAAGLDSLVLGECEILGQVRQAYELALQARTAGPTLSALFRQALQAGKRVRGETRLGQSGISVGTVVVERARELFGDLTGRTAMLIGAGKISSVTARALLRAGLRCILVANRTYDRACQVAAALGGQAVHFDALALELPRADIVICSTSAPHIVLHLPAVQAALPFRSGKPLLIADLAVPRNADPAIAGLPGVELLNIDDLALDLHNFSIDNPADSSLAAVEAILETEYGYFQRWWAARRCAPLIQSLREQAETIISTELERTLRRLGPLTAGQEQVLRQMGQGLVKKFLHAPVTWLHNLPPDENPDPYLALVEDLFNLP